MIKQNVQLLVVFLVSFVATSASAKCFNYTNAALLKDVPVIVQAKVSEFEQTKNEEGDKVISFKIHPEKTFKGNLSEKSYLVNYEISKNNRRPQKEFENNHSYNFFIRSVRDGKASVDVSECYHDISEDEIIYEVNINQEVKNRPIFMDKSKG